MQVSLVNDGPVTFWLRMPPDDKELTVMPRAVMGVSPSAELS